MAKKKDDETSDDTTANTDTETPKPLSLGRVVLFTDPEGKVHPAIVTEIAPSGEVHVCAFDSVFGPRNYVTSGEGSEPGQWSWPPRV